MVCLCNRKSTETPADTEIKKILLCRIVYRCKCHILLLSFWSCWRGWGLQTRRHGGGTSCVHTRRWTHLGSEVDPVLLGSPRQETPRVKCVTYNNGSSGGMLTSLYCISKEDDIKFKNTLWIRVLGHKLPFKIFKLYCGHFHSFASSHFLSLPVKCKQKKNYTFCIIQNAQFIKK